MTVFNVPNKTILFALGNKSPGEIAYCEEEKEYYIYKNDEWQLTEFKAPSKEITMSTFDINKQLYSQAEALTNFSDTKKTLEELSSCSDYWLLYGKEIGYFTLFKYKHDHEESLSEVVFDCLNYIADEIKGIEVLEDGSIEFWIKVKDSDLITVLYFFDYQNGVVRYG